MGIPTAPNGGPAEAVEHSSTLQLPPAGQQVSNMQPAMASAQGTGLPEIPAPLLPAEVTAECFTVSQITPKQAGPLDCMRLALHSTQDIICMSLGLRIGVLEHRCMLRVTCFSAGFSTGYGQLL